jgi:hypothetical protein
MEESALPLNSWTNVAAWQNGSHSIKPGVTVEILRLALSKGALKFLRLKDGWSSHLRGQN